MFRVRHLRLHGCFVHVNNFTLPHLRQLTSLELLCVEYTYSDEDQHSYVRPHDIWSSFIGSGIQLEELVHSTTTTSLIKYLSTYSGLKKLKLLASPYTTRSSSDKVATRFFNNVLPRHFETLERLCLEAYFEGKWCFTSHNAALITQCTKLNHLGMSIISDDSDEFQPEEGDQDSEEENDEFDGEVEIDQSGPEISKKDMVVSIVFPTSVLSGSK